MSGYTVDYRGLMDQARKIFDEADAYDRTADALKQAAEQLARCWEGPASRRFKQEQDRMYDWFKKMAMVCRDYAEKATVAAVRYLDAEEKARAAVNRR